MVGINKQIYKVCPVINSKNVRKLNKIQVNTAILDEFERCYGWLGRQMAEKLLLSLATINIHRYGGYSYRLRQNLLMLWKAGYFKSTIVRRFIDIINYSGKPNAILITDISDSSFMGSSKDKNFLVPLYAKYWIIVIDEMAKYTDSKTEQFQTLLSVLEDDHVIRQLIKFGEVSEKEKKRSKVYGIEWIDEFTFKAPVRAGVIGNTYKNDFITDEAMQSRFNIVTPKQDLDADLVKHINKYGDSFNVPPDICLSLQHHFHNDSIKNSPLTYTLPSEVIIDGVSGRTLSELKKWALAREWWGFTTSLQEIENRRDVIINSQQYATKNSADKVIDLISERPYTAKEIIEVLGMPKSNLYRILRRLPTIRRESPNGKMGYSLP